MAYTTIDDPSAFFQTILYEGGTADAKTFSGNSDLALNWFWGKKREVVQSPYFVDSVRGIVNSLQSNVTAAEYTDTEADDIASFDSNGFTFNDTGDQFNGTSSDASYVAWCWKAGTAFSNDTSSTSVGSIDSSGSVSTAAGFSIIGWTADGSANTIAHGLGAVPKMIIMKKRGATGGWVTYHQAMGNTHGLFLSTNSAQEDNAAFFDDTSPTSAVFTTGSDGALLNNTMIAYCFAEKQGYSKFGGYTGNGNVDGTFVYTGFKPAFVVCKKINGSGDWELYDNKRNGYNGGNVRTYVNDNAAEGGTGRFSLLSNGFKITTSSGNLNGSGDSFIYMAFAENPFVTSTGVPATAR